MESTRVYELLRRKVLVTRETARLLQPYLASGKATEGQGEIVLEFLGVEGMTPSFVDELLGVLEESLEADFWNGGRVVFRSMPTGFSSKFAALSRGRGFHVAVSADGAWHFTKSQELPSSADGRRRDER